MSDDEKLVDQLHEAMTAEVHPLAVELSKVQEERDRLRDQVAQLEVSAEEYNDTLTQLATAQADLGRAREALAGARVELQWERDSRAADRKLDADTIAKLRETLGVAGNDPDAIVAGRETIKQLARAALQSPGEGGGKPEPYALWKQANGDQQEYARLLVEHGWATVMPGVGPVYACCSRFVGTKHKPGCNPSTSGEE